MLPILGDIWFKSIDSPWANEAAKRMEKMLPPQLQEPKDGSEPLPPQVQQAMAQIQQGQQIIKVQAEQLQKAHQELGDKSAEVTSAQQKLDSESKLLAVEFKRMQAELRLKTLEGGQNTEQSTLEILKAFDERQSQLLTAFSNSLAAIEQARVQGLQAEAQGEASESQTLKELGGMIGQVVSGQAQIARLLAAPKDIHMEYDGKGRLIGGTARPVQ